MPKRGLAFNPQKRQASYNPSAFRRVWSGSYHTVRRRFVAISLAGILLLVMILLAVLGYFFRPAEVNSLVDSLIADTFEDASLVSYDHSSTRVDFPSLNGRGAVRLYNLKVRSPSDQYDVLNIPEVIVHYDLLGLPDKVLTRVEIPSGLTAVINSNAAGEFVDAGIFKASESDASSSIMLPEFELHGANVLFRFPSVFAEPQGKFAWQGTPDFSYQGHQAYYVSNIAVRGRINPDDPETLLFQGETDCEVWKKLSFNGEVSRDPSNLFLDLQAQRKHLLLDQELSNALQPDVLRIWEMLWAQPDEENSVDLSASVAIHNGKTELSVDGYYRGSIMYRDVPLRANNVRGWIHFNGKDITIKDAIGRRGNAEVRASGWLNGLGTPSESISITVEVNGLYADQTNFNALRGTPNPDGTTTFPEWEAYARRGAITKPERMPIFAQLYDQFEPSGLCNLKISVRSGGKRPGDEIDIDVDVLDVSARVWGNRLAMVEDLIREDPYVVGATRSLDRIDGTGAAIPRALAAMVHNAPGFPLEVYNVQGKVTGQLRNDRPNEFKVRGFKREEAALLGSKVKESSEGMVARRREGNQRIFVDVSVRESQRGVEHDNSLVTVAVHSDPLRIDDELIAAVPEDVQRVIRLFTPRGNVVAKRVTITADGMGSEGTTIALDLGLKDLDASYQVEDAAKPVLLSDLEAQVRYNSLSKRAQILDAKAKLLGIPVRISNFQIAELRPDTGISISADIEEFALDTRFFDYLPASAAEIKEFFTVDQRGGPAFALEGTAKAHVSATMGSDMNAPDRLEQVVVRVALDAKRVGFAPFGPFELKELVGEVVIAIRNDGIEVEIINMQGTAREETIAKELRAMITVNGGIFLPKNGGAGSFDFAITAERLLLSRTLQSAIDSALGGSEGESSGILSLWQSLEPNGQPIGRVAVNGKVSGALGGALTPNYAFEIALRDGTITYEEFALPVVGVDGDLTITNSGISFSGFKGRLRGAENATIEVPLLEKREDGSFVLAVAVKDLPLNENFRAALPAALQDVYSVMRPADLGARLAEKRKDQLEQVKPPANSVSGEITLTVSEQGFEYTARIALQAVDLEVGVIFEKCDGVIEQSASFMRSHDEEGKEIITPTITGAMSLAHVEWQKIVFEDVTTSFQLLDGRFVLPNIRGKLYGGNLRANMAVDAAPEGTTYSGKVSITRVQLGDFAEAVFGDATIDKTTGQNMQGGVDAEMEFGTADARGLIGGGRLDVGRIPLSEEELMSVDENSPDKGGKLGNFGRVPLLSGLYDVLSLPVGEFFNEAHVHFQLYDRYLEIRQMELLSDGLAVKTQGNNFILFEPDKNGNQFDLTLVPVLFPRAPSLPGADLVFDAIRGLVLRLYVTGPMDNPTIEALSKKQYKDDFEEEKERIPTPFDDERDRKAQPDRVHPDYSPW